MTRYGLLIPRQVRMLRRNILICCMLIYRHQLDHGRHFLHEHPWGAGSWKLPRVESLVRDTRFRVVEGHMCQFGMTSHVAERAESADW